MRRITTGDYSAMLLDGWCPVWVGSAHGVIDLLRDIPSGRFEIVVYLRKGFIKRPHVLVMTIPDKDWKLVKKNSAYNLTIAKALPRDILPDTRSDMSVTRLAACLGVGAYSSMNVGISGDTINCPSMLIAGLDIESTTFLRDGGFPLFSDPIISISLVFNDETMYFTHTVGTIDRELPSNVTHKKFQDSSGCVQWILQVLIDRCPDIVCIHNGFTYDVPAMAHHAPPFMRRYFKEIKLGRTGTGYNLAVPGCYVVDTLFYLDKLHRSDYTSLSLANLAKHLSLPLKLGSPGFRINPEDDMYPIAQMLEYNMHDAWLHIAVAVKTNCIDEMACLCSVTKSPFEDISRFISGSMVTSLLVSEGVARSYIVDWAEPDVPMFMRYKGGLVIEPDTGLHKNVCVYDIKSMYPSIMMNLRVSQENILSTPDEHLASEGTGCSIPSMEPGSYTKVGRWYVYRSEVGYHMYADEQVMTSACLHKLTEFRATVGKTSTMGWALKIVSNSMYGAIGASTSGLYDPYCAGTVTGMGRWITQVSAYLIQLIGSRIVYGDTDSLFVVPKSGTNPGVTTDIIHAIFDHVGLDQIRFEMEEVYSSVVVVKKKMYYATVANSAKTKVKGLAYRRQDRIDIARWAVEDICNILTKSANPKQYAKAYLVELFDRVDRGVVAATECLTQTKVDGVPHFGYSNNRGERVLIEAKDLASHPYRVSSAWVKRCVANAVNPIIEAVGLSDVRDLMGQRY